MVAKLKPENAPVNSNVNTNNINLNIEQPKRRLYKTTKKKPSSNILERTVVFGLIVLAILLLGYYITQSLDTTKEHPTMIQPNTTPIEGQKMN